MLASILACDAEGSVSPRQACDLGTAIVDAIEDGAPVEPTIVAIVERRRSREVFRWGPVTPAMGRRLSSRLAATVENWRAL